MKLPYESMFAIAEAIYIPEEKCLRLGILLTVEQAKT